MLLLLLCAPLAMAACPKVLEGLEDREFDVSEFIKVACGLKSFSREFWYGDATNLLMKYMAADAIVKNATICSSECIEKLDKRHHIRALAPLAQSARASFDAMDNEEAKANILGFYNNSYTYRLRELAASDESLDDTQNERGDSFDFRYAHLSASAEVAVMRATKRAFGIEDSAEKNSEHIATALYELRNAKLPRDAAEISALIKKTQELLERVNDRSMRFRDAFQYYALSLWLFKNEWIRSAAILPAAEILYVQYLTLHNEEAKAFIDSFLKSLKESYDKRESIVLQELWNGKHKQTTSGLGLSEDTASVLESTFPELFQYLYKNDYIVKKSLGTF